MSSWLAATYRKDFFDGYWVPFGALVLAWIATFALTPLVRKFAIAKGAIDDPKSDDRRVHREPTPRWGGIAIYAGIVIALLVALPLAYPRVPYPPYLVATLIGGAVIVAMGALDDLYKYSAKIQMLYIIFVAVAVQFFFSKVGRVQIMGTDWPPFTAGQWVDFGIWAIPITALYVFLVTKTMDTIDGIDGLASGLAGISAVTLALIAVHAGQPRVALIAAAVAGASLGFLPHNYHPARIFMGTGGAQVLGFLLACLSIVGALKTAAAVALVVPVLVFGVPLVDAVNVVVRRLYHRQPITQADKRHLHHTLLGRGMNQRQAVWVLYVVTLLLCGILLVAIYRFG